MKNLKPTTGPFPENSQIAHFAEAAATNFLLSKK